MKTQPSQGLTVLIPGASAGIGRTAPKHDEAAGVEIVLAPRPLALVEAAAHEVTPLGRRALPVRCDVTRGDMAFSGHRDTVRRRAVGLFDRAARRMSAPLEKKDA
jgi:NADP-dependent 3-hydroxy acid dehydrogenase YdfG